MPTTVEEQAEKDRKDAEARKDAEEQARKDEAEDDKRRADAGETAAECAARKDKARKDSEEIPAWADAFVTKVADAVIQKGEADRARKDAETKAEKEKLEAAGKETAADKARKDAEAASDKARKDAEARADAAEKSNKDMQIQLAAMNLQLKGVLKQPTADERNELAKAQARADGVARKLGSQADAPQLGESLMSYKRRQAGIFLKHARTDAVKSINLADVPDSMFAVAEDMIYADASAAGDDPAAAPAGQLYEEVQVGPYGQQRIIPHGDSRVFIDRHSVQPMHIKQFNKQKGG